MVKRVVLSTLTLLVASFVHGQDYRHETVQIDSLITADVEMESYIALYRDSLNKRMSDVLAVSKEFMDIGRPESNLSRFLADITFEIGKTWAVEHDLPMPDMALINNGGIRSVLHKGNITRRSIYEIIPFENTLTFVTIDGNTLSEIFNHIAFRGGEGVSNATLTIKQGKAVDMTVNGNVIDPTKSYTIVTLDYLANGGDRFKMMEKGQINNTGKCFRDFVIDYLANYKKSRRRIAAPTNRRITLIRETHEN